MTNETEQEAIQHHVVSVLLPLCNKYANRPHEFCAALSGVLVYFVSKTAKEPPAALAELANHIRSLPVTVSAELQNGGVDGENEESGRIGGFDAVHWGPAKAKPN